MALKEVFAVTRNGRRIEDVNYLTEEAARERLNQYRQALLKAHKKTGFKSDDSKYEVTKTSKPNKIW